jgi:hypothetical protein
MIDSVEHRPGALLPLGNAKLHGLAPLEQEKRMRCLSTYLAKWAGQFGSPKAVSSVLADQVLLAFETGTQGKGHREESLGIQGSSTGHQCRRPVTEYVDLMGEGALVMIEHCRPVWSGLLTLLMRREQY